MLQVCTFCFRVNRFNCTVQSSMCICLQETHRKIQAVLSSKKKPHRLLDEDSLTDCIAAMTQFLAAVYDTFPPQPLIVQVCMCWPDFVTWYLDAASAEAIQTSCS